MQIQFSGGVLLDTISESLSLEYVGNGAFELVSSQKYGTSLKQLHKDNIIRKLNMLKAVKRFNDNALLFRVNNRLRAGILKKLERDSKMLAKKMKKM